MSAKTSQIAICVAPRRAGEDAKKLSLFCPCFVPPRGEITGSDGNSLPVAKGKSRK